MNLWKVIGKGWNSFLLDLASWWSTIFEPNFGMMVGVQRSYASPFLALFNIAVGKDASLGESGLSG